MKGGETIQVITTLIVAIVAKASPSGSVRSGDLICRWLLTSPSAFGDPPRSGQAKLES